MQSKCFVMLGILMAVNAVHAEEDKYHQKRQIYREQVLPHAGGRIPDTAFQTDRLFLNRLQKEGIALPDGVVPEQRNPQVYQYYDKSMREVYHVALSSDARYTPHEGRFQYTDVPSVETTYLYPQIHGQPNRVPGKVPAYPIYKQLQLHNPQLNQVKLQPKKKTQILNVSPLSFGMKNNLKSPKTETYQNFNIINTPVAPPGIRSGSGYHYFPDQKSSNVFNDFDALFNNFDLHESQTSYNEQLPKYPLQNLAY